jgi:hypothetical protein
MSRRPIRAAARFGEPPAANQLIGVLRLAKLLYPNLFPEDLKAEVRRF